MEDNKPQRNKDSFRQEQVQEASAPDHMETNDSQDESHTAVWEALLVIVALLLVGAGILLMRNIQERDSLDQIEEEFNSIQVPSGESEFQVIDKQIQELPR